MRPQKFTEEIEELKEIWGADFVNWFFDLEAPSIKLCSSPKKPLREDKPLTDAEERKIIKSIVLLQAQISTSPYRSINRYQYRYKYPRTSECGLENGIKLIKKRLAKERREIIEKLKI